MRIISPHIQLQLTTEGLPSSQSPSTGQHYFVWKDIITRVCDSHCTDRCNLDVHLPSFSIILPIIKKYTQHLVFMFHKYIILGAHVALIASLAKCVVWVTNNILFHQGASLYTIKMAEKLCTNTGRVVKGLPYRGWRTSRIDTLVIFFNTVMDVHYLWFENPSALGTPLCQCSNNCYIRKQVKSRTSSVWCNLLERFELIVRLKVEKTDHLKTDSWHGTIKKKI